MAEGESTGAPAQEIAQMTDMLLEWMSFRGMGRNSDIPEELADGNGARQVVEDFSSLGHLESLNGGAWRVTPPVLAGLPSGIEGKRGAVLCGARTAGVLSNLSAGCHEAGAQLTLTPMQGCPAVVSVTAASKTALAAAAKSARLAVQPDAAATLLACTPAIRDWPRTPCAMVGGRVGKVRRFSRSNIDWVDSSLAEATTAKAGFFRIQRDWDWVSILKTGVSECAYIDDRAGRLVVASKLRAAEWTADSRALILPRQLVPPRIITRALTLCTGVLPRTEPANQRITFSGITPEILQVTLAITGLKLA